MCVLVGSCAAPPHFCLFHLKLSSQTGYAFWFQLNQSTPIANYATQHRPGQNVHKSLSLCHKLSTAWQAECVYIVIYIITSVQCQVRAGSCLFDYLLWQVAFGIRLTFGPRFGSALLSYRRHVCTRVAWLRCAHFQTFIITEKNSIPNTYRAFLILVQMVTEKDFLSDSGICPWACGRQAILAGMWLPIYFTATLQLRLTRIIVIKTGILCYVALAPQWHSLCTNRFWTISTVVTHIEVLCLKGTSQ